VYRAWRGGVWRGSMCISSVQVLVVTECQSHMKKKRD
jgi:hypothetical protein